MASVTPTESKRYNSSSQTTGLKRTKEKRSCIPTACRPCRKRKTRCDGQLPLCSTCHTYKTECGYDFNTDRRRRPSAAYVDALRARIDYLQNLVDELRNTRQYQPGKLSQDEQQWDQMDLTILQRSEQEHPAATRANNLSKNSNGVAEQHLLSPVQDEPEKLDGTHDDQYTSSLVDDVSKTFGELRMTEDGDIAWFGPSSNLNLVADGASVKNKSHAADGEVGVMDFTAILDGDSDVRSPMSFGGTTDFYFDSSPALSSEFDESVSLESHSPQRLLEDHLLSIYWTWTHPYFVLISKHLFLADLEVARNENKMNKPTKYYSPLLLNAILAHAAHFSRHEEVWSNPADPRTAGNIFFKRARRLLESEIETPGMTTVQALALMGSREAGCGRNGLGWLYSGMSFRMALDLGLHLSCEELIKVGHITEDEANARLTTYWGCYAYDKAWSAYLGKPESIPTHLIEDVPWPSMDPGPENDLWVAYGEGPMPLVTTKIPTVVYTASTSRQIIAIQEILGSVVRKLYSARTKRQPPNYSDLVTQLHYQLLEWLRGLPSYLKVRNHGFSASHLLPHALVMHVIYHTATILLFRPFISHLRSKSLPKSFDPLGTCTSSASKIVTLVKSFKKDYSLQYCHNMAVHGLFTAATIHLVNVVSTDVSYEHSARQHLVRCVEMLKEMSTTWPSAFRCLLGIHTLSERYGISLTVPTTAGSQTAEDEDISRDYTFESRSKQQTMSSMTGMPQLQQSGQQQDSSSSNLLGLMSSETAALPPATEIGSTSPQQPPEEFRDESYIYTDFDMSFFDSVDVAFPPSADEFSTNPTFFGYHMDNNNNAFLPR